ncbi:MAG: diguanylate cyclase, partial [Methyloversatilis sp.]|nr:diguanylate cyclase [Methyloversatilis sp.]
MLLMLFFGGLVGVLVALASTVMVGREERERMQRHLAELMATVERTASVAAFARDEQLANEVAQGLLLNDAVARVVITEADHVLASAGEADNEAGVLRLPVLVRPLTSPFAPDQQVGELRVWPASSKIAQAAGSYSRFIAIILLIELVFVVLSVAWVVLNVFTRPVKKLSDDLH